MSRELITHASVLDPTSNKYKEREIGVKLKNVIGYKEEVVKFTNELKSVVDEENKTLRYSFINNVSKKELFKIIADTEMKLESINLITSGAVYKEVDRIKTYLNEGGSGVKSIPSNNEKVYLSGTITDEENVSNQYFDPDVYLGNEPGSLYATNFHGDLNGNADTASKLETARKLSISGAAKSDEVDFDGSSNAIINVTELDASKIKGVLPLDTIPPRALENIVYFNDSEDIDKEDNDPTRALFKLTIDDVQIGDTCKGRTSGRMFLVVDDTKLDCKDGYEEYSAGIATAASKLEKTVLINGVAFDGSNDITVGVKHTSDNTRKIYLSGTIINSDGMADEYFDPEVYLGTEAGSLYANNFYGAFKGNADSADMLSGFIKRQSTISWGELSKPDYTAITRLDGPNNGSLAIAEKSDAMYVQIDGFFCQNEGKYICLDSDNYKKYCTPDNIGAAPSSHTHSSLSVHPENYKQGTDLPSTYPRGETIFFSNDPENKFNNVSHCTIHTIKGYTNMACIQFLYPYNTNADTIYYRTAIFNTDSWRDWKKISVDGHTHDYAGSSSAGGSANSAVKLDTSAGSATQPVYFNDGKPAACTYTLGKSVPSDAAFTDTWRGIQNNLTSDSTTDSLSAAQGKALKELVDKKVTGNGISLSVVDSKLSVTDKDGNKIDISGGGYYKGSSAPSDTTLLWIDTGNSGIMKYHNGTSWVPIASTWG